MRATPFPGGRGAPWAGRNCTVRGFWAFTGFLSRTVSDTGWPILIPSLTGPKRLMGWVDPSTGAQGPPPTDPALFAPNRLAA
ncbi:hypothetical protein CEP88_00405 (plasmid) [Roseobacter denitrificans]|nr:hypothetical protein CEP88_00405 [Roseobacter denitrificans]